MAIRDIVNDSDPLIRKTSREVTAFDAKLAKLIDDMWETMIKADGVGLAAVQVGILRRLAIVEFDGVQLELVNPVINAVSDEMVAAIEGCLSVDKSTCYVERPQWINISYQDRYGYNHTEKVEGYVARICAHEIDHLDGHLFYDKKIDPPKNADKIEE